MFDHFTTVPRPTQEITFELFTMLAALAQATSRARIGHMVICTGFRNPALTAKMASTIDVISGGRFELGIGAGWKEDEWLTYGYGFPTLHDRLGALGDHLEVIRRMLGPGNATYVGPYARVEGAINVPKGIQAHIPIIVGGNGQQVTFRYAARYADELNLVFLEPDEVRLALPVARQRCEEEGRDPATLRVSLYCRDADTRADGQARVDRLGAYAELGLDRLVALPVALGHERGRSRVVRRGLRGGRDRARDGASSRLPAGRSPARARPRARSGAAGSAHARP